ncbi:MAG: hypothetical protein KC635_14100 [Myxococcales bacterium]|nr:hypothetical protein [Myxococcales bacterium]MCB9735506.1 hypothetical protein [Deltaproteobacteria bacterium]
MAALGTNATRRARPALRSGALGAALAFALAAAPGCGKSDDAAADGGARVRVDVAPLAYPALSDVIYRVSVRDRDGGLVWTKDAGSAAYGDGKGALSLVGPCDASDGKSPNRVQVAIVDLIDPGGAAVPAGDWYNPAPVDAPLEKDAPCTPSGDTAVSFDLTVLRAAKQGFFDIAVTFGDIFCSAKLDCLKSDDTPLELLFDPATEERAQTVVVAFACTAGIDATGAAEPTWLHLTDVAVTCDGLDTMYLDPALGPGQHGGLGAGTFFETAIYQTTEALPNVDKCSWNTALGLNLAAAPKRCRLLAQATASHATFGAGGRTPTDAVWPYLAWDAPLTDENGALACGRHALDSGDGVVRTGYTAFAGAAFQHEWRCGAPTTDSVAQACDGAVALNTGAVAYPTPAGLSVAVGGNRSPVYTLPDGMFVGSRSTCCANPCCDVATP